MNACMMLLLEFSVLMATGPYQICGRERVTFGLSLALVCSYLLLYTKIDLG